MTELDWTDDRPRDDDWLAGYRRAVEQLRGETVAELGRQPMPPEALSAIALAITSVPLVALLLPPVPIEPQVLAGRARDDDRLAGVVPYPERALRPLP